MKKFLYLLPAILICLIYGFVLLVLEGSFDAVVDAVQSVAVFYLLLPVIGSALLLKNKWWGSLFGAGMGLPNMKKYSDNMKIESEVGKGTVVTLEFLLND